MAKAKSGKTPTASGRLGRWVRAPFGWWRAPLRWLRAPGRWLAALWGWVRVKVLRRAPVVPGRKTPVLVASKRQSQKQREARRALTRRIALSTLKISLLVLLIGAALIMFFEKRMIFPSQKWPDGYWEDADREIPDRLEVELTAEDGIRITGWWVPHDAKRHARPRGTVLFFHGHAGNLSHRTSWLAWLAQRGWQSFAIDYRGYGKSDGAPSEKGLYRDARAAYDYVVNERKVAPADLLLMGRSLGGSVAVELAGDGSRPVSAVVLESPFESIGAMSRLVIPVIPVRWVLATRLDNASKVGTLRQPLLVIARGADEVVPVAQTHTVFEAAAGSPKELYVVPGAFHNDSAWDQPEYGRRFDQFTHAHVGKR